LADDLEAYLGEVLIGGLEPGAVVLAAYDPAWAVRYEHEAARIRQALGPRALRVEHVGSTAVRALAAKPIIDILVVVEDSSREDTYLPDLEQAGYVLRVREPAFHEHRMLRTPGADVHVHVYAPSSAEVGRMLAFRDHLRRNTRDRDAYAAAKRRLAERPWKSMQYYAEAKSPVIERILARAGGDGSWESFRRLLLPALIGLLVFAYQVPLVVVVPTNIHWLMKADRAAMLSGWLFERNEPWTLPFGILHTMIAPLVITVGYSDALPIAAVPAKLFFGWVGAPWQYSGMFLLAGYILQGVFGYLALRALRASRGLSLAGAAFFAASPAMLHRFEHVGLSAHWELLAAWWLYLRRPPAGGSWRFLVPWLLLLAVTIPTYAYLGLMVGVICSAAYVRAVCIDRTIGWWTAAWHAVVGLATVLGVFWVFGFFVLTSHGEPGFGQFSADLLAFVNPAGFSRFLKPIQAIQRGYENFFYLGLGLIVLIPIAIAVATAAAIRSRRVATADERAPARQRPPVLWPVLWPAVLAAVVMFTYALATPVRFGGHALLTVPLYAHLPMFTSWFRGSGRFAWPMYYLVMALTLAAIARFSRPAIAYLLLAAAFALQMADMRPLRATVQRDYTWEWPRLESPAWDRIGHSFRSLRLVPPIIANRTACRRYDRPYDYEIRFGVLAATQRMSFNSANPARIDDLGPLCFPMLDSLAHGLVDPATVYIPDATYREAIEWWARGRVVCGTIEEANVCVARPGPAAAVAPLTRRLLQEEPVPPATVLHVDLRKGDPAGVVDSIAGFQRPDSGGRFVARPANGPSRASLYFSRPLAGAITMVVEASAPDSLERTAVTVTFGDESRVLSLGPAVTTDTLRFREDRAPQILQFIPGDVVHPAPPVVHGGVYVPARIKIRQLTIGVEYEGQQR
jgi:GrpB-like predicted nucleotidyltransferase (UPF0157 family)